jgi:hypothetical protein
MLNWTKTLIAISILRSYSAHFLAIIGSDYFVSDTQALANNTLSVECWFAANGGVVR